MKREDVLLKMTDIFRDTFDNDGIIIEEDTSAADIDGWDSLMHINIIAQIEDEFNIQFPMEVIISMKNVGEIIDKIIELGD